MEGPYEAHSAAPRGCATGDAVLRNRAIFVAFQGAPRSPRDCKSQPDFKGLAPVIGGACACGITERTVEVAGEQTHLSGMAGRYATALFELALEQNAVDAVEPISIGSMRSSPEVPISCVWSAVRFSLPTRRSVPWAPCSILPACSGLSAQFLLTVAANRRLFAVARHDQGVSAAGRAPSRRGQCRSDGRAEAERAAPRPRSGKRSMRSPASTFRST